MATQYAFGKIVTDGLVIALDAADRNSYTSGSSIFRSVGQEASTANIGSGLLFDGISLSGSAAISFPGAYSTFQTQQGTYSLWVKMMDGNPISSTIVFYSGGTTNNLCYLYRNTNFSPNSAYGWLLYYTGSAGLGAYLPISTYSTSSWTNTVLTYTSDGTGSVYINGVLNNRTNMSNFTQWNRVAANSPSIQMSAGSNPPGSFSNFQFYNKALSAAEVLQNYNAQKSRFGLI
jgi:hypothetical protein